MFHLQGNCPRINCALVKINRWTCSTEAAQHPFFIYLFFLFQVGLLSVLQHSVSFIFSSCLLSWGSSIAAPLQAVRFLEKCVHACWVTLWLPACGALLPFSSPLDVTNIFVLHMHAVFSEAQGRRCECQLASASRLCFPLSFFYFEATSCLSEFNTSLNVLLMQTDGTNRSITVCAQSFYTDNILHKTVTCLF